ncbi:MAG: 3-oxoacyl-[acyl-carrier-protein] synthase-3 [Candidatus Marinamargulisbacteria bacterium]|jgi:3-oxoacyl-[acyl-carrier-protein] synthase-3
MTDNVGIVGVGKYLPPKIVTNQNIVEMGLDTSHEWIVSRTGIEERRIAEPGVGSSDLGAKAGRLAIENAGLSPDDIDLIIVATTSPDYPSFPSTACLIQKKLGLRNIGAFDLAAACTGFNYALTTGAQFVKTGFAKKVLVIGVDCLSKLVDWQDRSICVLFGDGAGAVVLGEVAEGQGILSSVLHADGNEANILKIPAGGTANPITPQGLAKKENFIFMDGKSVFKVAVRHIVPAVESALKKADLSAADIDCYISHQANIRILDYAQKKLGLTSDQVFVNIQKYGNTSAASIPIAITEAAEQNKVSQNDVVALAGFGAGFTWSAIILKWSQS